MPTWEVVVERIDPTDRMNVTADSEAQAVEGAIRAFGGLNVVRFVTAEKVPEMTLDDALAALEEEAAAERTAQEQQRVEREEQRAAERPEETPTDQPPADEEK